MANCSELRMFMPSLRIRQLRSFDTPRDGVGLRRPVIVSSWRTPDGFLFPLWFPTQRHPSASTVTIVPGAILLRRKLPGVDKLYACNGMALRMYRVADGRQIGFAVPSACSDTPNALVWHDAWADFTADEKQRTLEAVQSYIHQQVGTALVTVNIWAP